MMNLERQAGEFIAETFWGYANGIEDCGIKDYPLMTKEEYKKYIWETLEYEKDIVVNGVERKHLYFIGKDKFFELVDKFLNKEDVQEYIKAPISLDLDKIIPVGLEFDKPVFLAKCENCKSHLEDILNRGVHNDKI